MGLNLGYSDLAQPLGVPVLANNSLTRDIIQVVLPVGGTLIGVSKSTWQPQAFIRLDGGEIPTSLGGTTPSIVRACQGASVIEYNGTTQGMYSTFEINPRMTSFADITLMALVQPTSLPASERTAFSFGNKWDTTVVCRLMTSLTAGQYGFQIRDSLFVAQNITSAGSGAAVGRTSVLFGRHSNSLNFHDLYNNGEKVATATATTLAGAVASATSQGFFRRSSNTSFFPGFVGICATWARALSEDEIQSLTRNPWQLLESSTRPIWSNAAVAAAFLARQGLNIPQAVNRASTF